MTMTNLPTPERFAFILQPITGEGAATGVAAAARSLQEIDVPALVAELTGRLDATIADTLSAGGATVTDDLVGLVRTAVESVPSDPDALMAPLAERLEAIRAGIAGNLSPELESGLAGLEELRSLASVEPASMLEGLNPAVDAIKSNLVSGAFGRLRSWSEQVAPLAAEVEQVARGGVDSIQDRLIEWVAGKVRDLERALLPVGGTKAGELAAALSAVSDAEPAAAIGEAADSLEGALARLADRLERGDFTVVAPFAEAEARLAALVDALGGVSATVSTALERSGDPAAIAADLDRRIDQIREVEIVDLGSIRDGFEAAIASLRAEVDRVDLQAVERAVRAPLERLGAVVEESRLGDLHERVEGLGEELEGLADGLEGGLLEMVSRIRAALADARTALRTVAERVGRFEPDGTYRFHVEDEIRSFLESIRDSLDREALPSIQEFRARIASALDDVQAALEAVRGRIDGVRVELEAALGGAAAFVEELDVERRVAEIADRTRRMLDELDRIDFDVVIDPVVAEIGGMSDGLREIDASSLNEVLRGALRLSVDTVIDVDFAGDITDLLLARLDEIVERPRRALEGVQAELEGSLAELAGLSPDELLAPLDDLFAPVREGLDGLRLEALAEPLESWHASVMEELEKVSPAALLEPLADLHRELVDAVARIDATVISEAAERATRDLVAGLRELDVRGLVVEVGDAIARARTAIDALSPDRLLSPASRAYSKIVDALDAFDPATLLEPFARMFEWLDAAVDGLTAEQVGKLWVAIRPLVELSEGLDPEAAHATLRDASAGAHRALSGVETGRLLADLQAAYRALLGSFDPSVAPPEVLERLSALNPLRHEGLSRALAAFEEQKARLERELLTVRPPSELTAAYAEISERLRSLVPTWADGEMTADSVGRAVRRANPVALQAEVRALWEAAKDRLRELDPAGLAEPLSEAFSEATDRLAALDPAAVLEFAQGTIDRVLARVEAVDVALLTDEVDAATVDLRAVVQALDPAPAIRRLDEGAAAVRDAVAGLEPRALLEDLQRPLEVARTLAEAFDPAGLREPLEDVFERVQATIEAADVGTLLSPLIERLEQLRVRLEAGLRRAETAFNGMLAAIPL